jgi:hypothetical protein
MAAKKRPAEDASAAETGFTEEERAAMRDHARELRARKRGANVDGEAEVRAKIAEMHGTDRVIAERLHRIIREHAPSLVPRTWYGMPAYSKDGDVLCWFQPAEKFKARYGTLGFGGGATLDEGHMWPNSYAITDLTASEEQQIVALLKKAVG